MTGYIKISAKCTSNNPSHLQSTSQALMNCHSNGVAQTSILVLITEMEKVGNENKSLFLGPQTADRREGSVKEEFLAKSTERLRFFTVSCIKYQRWVNTIPFLQTSPSFGRFYCTLLSGLFLQCLCAVGWS